MNSPPLTTLSPVAPTTATSRRRFLRSSLGQATLLGGSVIGAAPMVATAATGSAPLTLRFQSSWSSKDIFHEFALDYVQKVAVATQGRVRISILPAGAVVKPFDLLDAVSKGALDGAHCVTAYGYDKDPALSLWGCGPAFGMDANMVLAWHQHGGGKALLAEIYAKHGLNVVSNLYGPMPTQPLGWFKKRIHSLDDLRNLKFRSVGLATELFRAMGMQVNPLPGADIVAALDRGLLDAAEFNNASSDRQLGFPSVASVCMLRSFHQSAEQFEVIFNQVRYERLDKDIKAAMTLALHAASTEMSWKMIDRYSQDYQAMREENVQFHPTPEPILKAQLEIWNQICARHASENPLFKKVLESMSAFARRACLWHNDTAVDFKMAYAQLQQPANK